RGCPRPGACLAAGPRLRRSSRASRRASGRFRTILSRATGLPVRVSTCVDLQEVWGGVGMGQGGTRCDAGREIGVMMRLGVAQPQEFRTFTTKVFIVTIQLVTDLFPHYAMQCFTMKNADGAMPDTFFALRQIILDHGKHRPCALAPAVGASNQ